MTCFDDELDERIAKVKALVDAYEDALLNLVTGEIQSYTLDTGQTRQTVTKLDITSLENKYESLLNLYAMLCARRDGSNTLTAVPLS